ncbi:hypothetical protein [Methylobacter sp.]|uniref:hypothetical protein n=1 Tax=Methylobacter sp. TaxID=2051955 RepID=UPI0012057339|nr:hypothetical protein [Methylobacter sp.]TAK64228.1 MAG: hypothetical protein EPO18_04725 [Methylobacter sp.]
MIKNVATGGWLAMILWAGLITYLLVNAAVFANLVYYEKWPLQGDTLSYWTRDIALSKTSGPNQEVSSYRIQALQGVKLNGKDPVRTAFFALLPADAPSSINGHLYFSAITAFLFLFMLMIVLLRRTGSFLYAMAAPLVTLLPSGLFNPIYGLPSKLPDLPASFLFGAALFAIFSGKNSRKSELNWIFIAGLLLGLATLARYQLWIYGLFVLGPIAFLCGVRRYFTDGRHVSDIVIYPAVLVAGLGIIAGYFILTWTQQMLAFYSIAGYALNATIATSLKTTGVQLLDYLGMTAVLAGVLVLTGFISIRHGILSKANGWDALAILWALIAYPFLLFGIMRVESIVEQTYYVVPGLMIFLLAPFNGEKGNKNSTEFKIFSFCLILILPLAAIGKTYGYLNSENFIYPREGDVKVAKFQHDLAELVAVNIPQAKSAQPITIDSNFFYYARMMELLVKSKFNRDSKSLMIFQIRQSQWKLSFTGEEETDKSRIMKALAEKVGIFMALTKPLGDAKMNTFVDDYTEHLAEYVNLELAANPAVWEKKGAVTGPYGEVTVYKNRTQGH